MRRLPLLVAFSLALSMVASSEAHAGSAVLGEHTRGIGPVAVRVAVSSDGARTTRWQSVVIPAGERIAWLVPARPGAKVDFAGEPFFAALDESTTVHVARPGSDAHTCGVDGEVDTVSDEVPRDPSTKESKEPFIISDAASLQQFAQEGGFAVPAGLSGRIFRDGFSFVALTFSSSARPTTTPVVRVSDDGPASLPLVLTQAGRSNVPVTAWVVAEGTAQLGSTVTVADEAIVWGPFGSSYRDARAKALVAGRGFGFLTEGAGHELVFGPRAPLPDGRQAPSLVSAYASRIAKTPAESSACTNALGRMTNHPVRFGVVCAQGALASLSPATECVPSPGDTDVTAATCGTTEDDLAIALSGKRIDRIAVTRASGLLIAGEPGSFVGFGAGPSRDPLRSAKLDPACLPAAAGPQPQGPVQSAPPKRGGTGGPSSGADPDGPTSSSSGSGCSGGTTTVYASDVDTSSSSESCSSDTSDSSTGDGGCGGDTVGGDNDSSSCSSDSSDSSSDSCSSGSGDACDSPDASFKNGKRGKSPMSRAAFLIVALALPMRRLFRKRERV